MLEASPRETAEARSGRDPGSRRGSGRPARRNL